MRYAKLSTAILILTNAPAAIVSGCHSTQVSLASPRPALAAASSAKASGATSSEPLASHPPRHLPRDSEFTTYRNPDYGVSLRYPRNYALREGLEQEDSALVPRQQELGAQQPGAVVVAAIAIPDDAYPNTTFRSGSLQFVVNPNATPEACRSFALSADAASPDLGFTSLTGTQSIHGMLFDWRLRGGDGANGAYVEDVTYAGYSAGACYEFFLEVVAGDAAEPDSNVKPADISKILRALEKTVFSFQLQPQVEPSRSN